MTALVPLRAQATPATSSTSLWTLCQVLLGHKLRSPRCHKVQPDAAYRARRTRGQRHRASAPAHFVHSRWPRRWRKACVAEGMDGPGWLRHIAILRSCMAPVAVRKTRPPSCRHVRAASNCIADRVCMCRCVCLRACAGTGAAESHEEIAPARLDLPIHAAATCRFHIPGSPCYEGHISARMLGMVCGSVHGTGSEDS